MVQLEAVHQGTLDDLLREEAEDLQERRSDPYQREQLDLENQEAGIERLEARLERKQEKLLILKHKSNILRKCNECHTSKEAVKLTAPEIEFVKCSSGKGSCACSRIWRQITNKN